MTGTQSIDYFNGMSSIDAPHAIPLSPRDEEAPVLSFSTAMLQALICAAVAVVGWLIACGIGQWMDWNIGVYANRQVLPQPSTVVDSQSGGQSDHTGDSLNT